MAEVVVEIQEEKDYAETLAEQLEHIKDELEKKMDHFKKSRKVECEKDRTKTETLGRITSLCEEISDITSSLTSDILEDNMLNNNPNLDRLSLRAFLDKNRDSGISSASGSSVWSGSQKSSTNRLPNLAAEDTHKPNFILGSPFSSTADLGGEAADAYDPSLDVREKSHYTAPDKSYIGSKTGVPNLIGNDALPATDTASSGALSETFESNTCNSVCFSANLFASSFQVQVKTSENICIRFSLTPGEISSDAEKQQRSKDGSTASLAHDNSKISVASSADSVIDMAISSTVELPSRDALNDLSKHSSSSSEEDNTKHAIPVVCSDPRINMASANIVEITLVRKT